MTGHIHERNERMTSSYKERRKQMTRILLKSLKRMHTI